MDEINANGQYYKDIDKICSSTAALGKLKGKTVFVSGASGQIGSAVIDVMLHADIDIKIIAAGRDERKMRLRFGEHFGSPFFSYMKYDAMSDKWDLPAADVYICGAGNSSPDMIASKPVETIIGNINGLRGILEAARTSAGSRVLYISSSEVYGRAEFPDSIREDTYGTVDISNPRSSYAEAKRMAESMAVSFGTEFGTDTVIARPGHMYGPTASAQDRHISSTMGFDAAAGRDIVLKSDGSQKRSYLYIPDVASALITILAEGKSGEAYNIADPSAEMTIRELAELFASNGNVRLRFDIPTADEKKAFNPMNNSCLNGAKLTVLGWKALFSSETGVRHTVEILKKMADKIYS